VGGTAVKRAEHHEQFVTLIYSSVELENRAVRRLGVKWGRLDAAATIGSSEFPRSSQQWVERWHDAKGGFGWKAAIRLAKLPNARRTR
jgi:hypothetical protein